LQAYLKQAAASEVRDDDDADEEEIDEEDVDLAAAAATSSAAHNSHWLPPRTGGPSRYIGYYDAASLYPSSGEFICSNAKQCGRPLGRPQSPAEPGGRVSRLPVVQPPPPEGGRPDKARCVSA